MPSTRATRRLTAIGILISLSLCAASAQIAPPMIASKPVAAPPRPSFAPLSSSILTWDSELKSIDAREGDAEGRLFFSFTNVSSKKVTIIDVYPGCSCTTVHTPPMPWEIISGTSAQIGVTIDLRNKTGTLNKNITVTTDQGVKLLNFRVNILPVTLPQLSAADRASNMKIATADRQAIFKGDCVTCHVKEGEAKYGKPLYDADCAICHEGENRATMVPDLHSLKVATNPEFWRTWIAHGKPGSLMPAFSTADGGPLNDMQINSLAAYLNFTISFKPVTQLPPLK